MTDTPVAAEFVAEIRQVKTMVDKTVNVTLNLPETCREAAMWMMSHQSDMIRIVAVLEDTKQSDRRTKKRSTNYR